jgi:DNA mismatch endonuclease, patch repair protein
MRAKEAKTEAELRSEQMSRIRCANTKPELKIRRLVHAMGYRYRLHRADLPGKPDLVFPGRKKVIFVHGCFWHQHDCGRYKMPKSRNDFWDPKLARNKERDLENLSKLRASGWKYHLVWECELRDMQGIERELRRFLDE